MALFTVLQPGVANRRDKGGPNVRIVNMRGAHQEGDHQRETPMSPCLAEEDEYGLLFQVLVQLGDLC